MIIFCPEWYYGRVIQFVVNFTSVIGVWPGLYVNNSIVNLRVFITIITTNKVGEIRREVPRSQLITPTKRIFREGFN